MRPTLIFDKSFLQSLNRELLNELTLWFRPICVPTLVSEIVADLRLPESATGRLPRDVVMDLAAKMANSPGFTPMQWRKLALAELRGRSLATPMTGLQVPVDESAYNVQRSPLGVMYDGGAEQREWARLARGEFGSADEESATAWREGLAGIDLKKVASDWRPFADERLGKPKTIPELIVSLKDLLADPSQDVQLQLLGVGLGIVEAPVNDQTCALDRFFALPGSLLAERTPFLASVVQLSLTLVCGLSRDLIGSRSTHAIDLQYLYYAPFCQVFVSRDKLHSKLWDSATSNARFLWGDDLWAELKQRAGIRLEMTRDGWERWAVYRAPYGKHPPPIAGSLINEVYAVSGIPTGPVTPPMARTLADLDPDTRDLMRRFLRSVGKEWPYKAYP